MRKIPLIFLLFLFFNLTVFGEIGEYNALFLDFSLPREASTDSGALEFVKNLLETYPNILLLKENHRDAVIKLPLESLSWDEPSSLWVERCGEWQVRALILHRFSIDKEDHSELVWIDGETGIVSRDLLSLAEPSSQEFFFQALGYGTDFDPAGNTKFEFSVELGELEFLSSGDAPAEGDRSGGRPGDGGEAAELLQGAGASEESGAAAEPGDEPGESGPAGGAGGILGRLWPFRKGEDGAEFNGFFFDFTDRENLGSPDLQDVESLKTMIAGEAEIVFAEEDNIREILKDSGFRQPREGLRLSYFRFRDASIVWYPRMEEWGVRYLVLYKYAEFFGREFVDVIVLDAQEKKSASGRTGLSGGYEVEDAGKNIASDPGSGRKPPPELREKVPGENEPAGEAAGEPAGEGTLGDVGAVSGMDGTPVTITLEAVAALGADVYDTFLFDFTGENLKGEGYLSYLYTVTRVVAGSGRFKPARSGENPNIRRLKYESPTEDWERAAKRWDVRYLILLRLTEAFGREFVEWTLIDLEAEEARTGRFGRGEDFDGTELLAQLEGAGLELEEKAVQKNELDLSIHLFGAGTYPLRDLAKIQAFTYGGGLGLTLENMVGEKFGVSGFADYRIADDLPEGINSITTISGTAFVSWQFQLGASENFAPGFGGGFSWIAGEYNGNLAVDGQPEGLVPFVNLGLMVRLGKKAMKFFIFPQAVYYLDSGTLLDIKAMAGLSLF